MTGEALGPSAYAYRVERDGASARLVVEASFDPSRYAGATRRAVTDADAKAFEEAHARLAGGAPLVVGCTLDGDVAATAAEHEAAVEYLATAAGYLGWVLGSGADPGPAPTGVTLSRPLTVPEGTYARRVAASVAAGTVVTALPPPADVAGALRAAFDGTLAATGPDGAPWSLRLGAPYALSDARVYALAPLAASRLGVTVPTYAYDPAHGLPPEPTGTMAFAEVDPGEWATVVLDALEAVDSPALARTRTRLAAAIASGLRQVCGDEADEAAFAAARDVLTQRLLVRVGDRPAAVTQHVLAQPPPFAVVVEGPRTHRLAAGTTLLTYAGDPRPRLVSRLAYVEHADGPLAVVDPPVAVADVPGPLPLPGLPSGPSPGRAECLPREPSGDAAETLRRAAQWAYRLTYTGNGTRPEDTVEVAFSAGPEAAAFAPVEPATATVELVRRLGTIAHAVTQVLPHADGDALTRLADGLDAAWAAAAAVPPALPDGAVALRLREDEVDGALRVTVSYGLPDGLVPTVLVDGCDAVEAEPAPSADNHPARAWTYRRADGTPLPYDGAPPSRTVEVAWLDVLRHPVVTASLRLVRNAGAPAAFVHSTAPTPYLPVTPSLDRDVTADVAALSGGGVRPLRDHLAALVAALPGDGLTAGVAVTFVRDVGGVPVSVPVTLLTPVPWDAGVVGPLAEAVEAWHADVAPDDEGASYAFDITLSGAEPVLRVRGPALRLADVGR
ncbi:MAG TPA: hypothetical protein VGX28_13820 [Frankiaceae bacterium]|jgi:hypothetical protein|nr:hypothetical protein [Frankiaceae bacterium]